MAAVPSTSSSWPRSTFVSAARRPQVPSRKRERSCNLGGRSRAFNLIAGELLGQKSIVRLIMIERVDGASRYGQAFGLVHRARPYRSTATWPSGVPSIGQISRAGGEVRHRPRIREGRRRRIFQKSLGVLG